MDEKNQKSRNAERIPCDFCSEKTAVLYCRADSAKLCLFCDLHVHSANDLSRKHVRSQICDNCGSEPVTARCATDNLVLCQECDCDAHGNCSASAAHERSPVEGFSGCPSPLDLASTFGFDVEDKKSLVPIPAAPPLQSVNSVNSMFSNWSTLDSVLSVDPWGCKSAEMSFQDLMVPGHNANVPFSEIPALLKRQNPSCGKQRQVIFKQLVEMMKRDLSKGDGGGGTEADLGPGTPGRSVRQGSFVGVDGGDGANQLLQHQTPYTSLLVSAVCGDLRENEQVVEEDVLWDNNPRSRHSSQIWDFHSGISRNHEVPSQLDIGYGTTDAVFLIENYSDLIERGPMEATKVLEDIYQINCSTTHEDNKSQNNNSNNPASSESDNLATIRSSSGFTLATSKATSNTKDVNLMNQVHRVGGESAKVTTKANMELLAQNRGNAMLRYREKKKTRRYDKHIRYESRKARADTRKRVKGRFVKASEAPDIESSR